MSRNCAVHGDFSDLKLCTQNIRNHNNFIKNVFFITIIRDPLSRYVSEWSHSVRQIKKIGRNLTIFEASFCNKEKIMENCIQDLKNINIEQFPECFPNVVNRHTRLLADYDVKDKNCTLFQAENKMNLLAIAKKSLEEMAFFGITEYEEKSQKLFEKTFKNSLKIDFKVPNRGSKSAADILIKNMSIELRKKINKLNDLDFELYKFAKSLFFSRLKHHKI